MNRECMGHRFILDGKEYWRCLMNGVVTKGNESIESCSTCGRKIFEDKEAQVVKKLITEIQVLVVFQDAGYLTIPADLIKLEHMDSLQKAWEEWRQK